MGFSGLLCDPGRTALWALATKDFDKEHQFNQKYLELLPKLVELAAAEGSIQYMDMAQMFSDKLTYKTAQQAKLVAAVGGHVDALEWLEERRPTEYKRTDAGVDLTDVARVWVAGATHPPVRNWAWGVANRCLDLSCEHTERELMVYCENRKFDTISRGKSHEKHRLFHGVAASVAALQGDVISLDISFEILGDSFPKWFAMGMAIIGGNAAAVEWCGKLAPTDSEILPGYAVATAVKHNRIDIAKLLIEKGYPILRNTICATSSDIKTLQYLVDIGCTLTEKNVFGGGRGGQDQNTRMAARAEMSA